ncbi:MAG: carboxypeptidase-like regulatory domain-containing protein [Planctomycetota bacterium]
MRPLLVLLLVLGSLGALYFALTTLGDGPRGTNRDGVEVAEPTNPVATPAELEQPSARVEAEPSAVSDRTAVQPEAGPRGRNVPFGVLAGLVVDATEVPIAGATISLLNAKPSALGSEDTYLLRGIDPPKPVQKVVTEADGRFRFERLDPLKDWSLVVTHERYQRYETDTAVPVPEGGERNERITLIPGLTCSGVVRDAQTRQPIAGASLVVESAMAATNRRKSPGRLEAKTDAQGAYVFYNTSLSAQQARILTVSAPGYATQVVNNFAMAALSEPEARFKNKQAGIQAESKVQDFDLERGLTIAGRVVRPDRRGASGIEVEAMNQAGTVGSIGRDVSAENGEFLIEGLAAGIYLVRVVPTGNYDAPALQRVEADSKDVVLELFEKATVIGQVLDSSGKPLSRFTVKARTSNELSKAFGAVMANRSIKDSKDGAFELSGLPEGSFVIEATSEGYAPSFSEPFDATQGLTTTDIIVRMTLGGELRGQILDAYTGEGLAGAEVATLDNNFIEGDLFELFSALEPTALTKVSVFTDAEGRFAIERMTPGEYQVQIKVRGYSSLITNDVAIVDGQVTELPAQRLGKGARITGVVFSAENQPLAGATVQLTPADPSEVQGHRQTRTDGEGRFSLDNVRPGDYELSAMRPNSGLGNPFEAIGDLQQSRMDVTVEDSGTYDFKLRLGRP